MGLWPAATYPWLHAHYQRETKHPSFNYYINESLIAAGGDPLGTLDLYQVYGYPEWSDVVLNMFKYSKKYWLPGRLKYSVSGR